MNFGISMMLGAVFILLLAAGCTQNGNNATQTQGRAVFTVADAAADMGAVTSVKVTVDSLEVQNTSGGWITVSSSPQTYDLMQLRASGMQSLLADTNLENGTYGQVRMIISKVMVTDSSGVHEAKLPSGVLKIVGGFTVSPNSTVAVNFDFLADQSLHVTGNGQYILAPVVHMQEHADSQVDASSKENVKVNGGRIRTDTVVGMDENGNVGAGMKISPNLNLSIRDDGTIMNAPWSNAGGNGNPNAGGNKGADSRTNANTDVNKDIGNVIQNPSPPVVVPTTNLSNGSYPGIQTYDGTNPKIGGNVSTGGSITPPARAASYCSGKNGPQLVNCTVGIAIETKDVNVCTTLADHDALNTCITTWCAAVRDFNSCYGIANKDDQLMCLSRCNTNRNQ